MATPRPRRALGVCASVAGITLLLAARVHLEKYAAARPKPKTPITAQLRQPALHTLSFGNDAALRAWLWTRLLSEANYEQWEGEGTSWEYAQLDAIVRLDRDFLSAYRFGSLFLSTLRQDREGALALLQRWVHAFPNQWRANYMLGYHLFFEMNRPKEAAPHILAAAGMPGAPMWLGALGARVFGEAEAPEQQLRILLDLYASLPAADARMQLRDRVRSAHYRSQLATWKNALAAYRAKNAGRAPASMDALHAYVPGNNASAIRELASNASQVDSTIARELVTILQERFPFRLDGKTGMVVSADPERTAPLENGGVHKPKHAGGT